MENPKTIMKPQNKRWSMAESAVNTVIGLATSFLVQLLIFPYFGIVVSHETNIKITLLFFVVSFLRGYLVRRIFNKIACIRS